MLSVLNRGWRRLFPVRAKQEGSEIYLKVAKTLEDFVEGKGGAWDWDDYVAGTKFRDPYLVALQRRMLFLDEEFPAQKKGQYCGPAGFEVIRASIHELRTKAAEHQHN